MPTVHRGQHKRWTHILSVLVSLSFLTGLIIVSIISLRWFRVNGITPQFVLQLVSKKYSALKQANDRVNLLVLGVSGVDRDGRAVTDMMAVVSIHAQTGVMSLIMVPGDIWSDTLKDNINKAYQYGEEKKKNGGLVLAKVVVEDVLGIPIQYVLKIDFQEFTKSIDLLEGIDVDVKNTFTDSQFPEEGTNLEDCKDKEKPSCLFTTVVFERGFTHMNGKRALIYVRSKFDDGGEGRDFARSRRQQEILVAFLNRIKNPADWFTPEKSKRLYDMLLGAIQKDFSTGELISLSMLMARASKGTIHKISIDSLLESPNMVLFGEKFVLTPKDNWDTLHTYIKQSL